MSSVMRRRRGVMEKLLCAGGFMSQTTFPSLCNDAQVATHSGSIEMPAALESAARCIPLCGLVQCALCGAPHKAHARRYFFQAVQLNRKDLLALEIVVEIDKLFEVEADAKAAGLGAGERLELRKQPAEPIVEGLKQRIESARASALPRS